MSEDGKWKGKKREIILASSTNKNTLKHSKCRIPNCRFTQESQRDTQAVAD